MMGKMVCHEFFCVKIIVELKTKAIFAPAIGNNRGCFKFGSVVQLVRIHACHAWGRGFESRPNRKMPVSRSTNRHFSIKVKKENIRISY